MSLYPRTMIALCFAHACIFSIAVQVDTSWPVANIDEELNEWMNTFVELDKVPTQSKRLQLNQPVFWLQLENLLKAGASFDNAGQDINERSKTGSTLLIEAIKQGQRHLVHKLLLQGAQPNKHETIFCRTPFLQAARSGQIAIMELLRTYGADTQAHDARGMTALHHAVDMHKTEVVTYLLQRRLCSVNTRDKNAMLPIAYARAHGYQDVIELLTNR